MKVLVVKNGTFRAHFEGKNGSGSWIRTSDQVVNNFASSPEFVGEIRFREFAKLVI